jgi:hypothetical protein
MYKKGQINCPVFYIGVKFISNCAPQETLCPTPFDPAIGASPPKGPESIFMTLNPAYSAFPLVVAVAIS